VPILKDTGEVPQHVGQLVIAASTIADFATIILLSLLSSAREHEHDGAIVPARGHVSSPSRWSPGGRRLRAPARVRGVLQRLQDTTAQIRVRGASCCRRFVALATELGLEVILGRVPRRGHRQRSSTATR
jgi:hypothetical protein